MTRLRRHLVLCAVVFAALAGSATDAFASHFRYGTITWSTPNPANPRIIEVRVDSAWRRSFFSPLPNVGTVLPASSLAVTLDILNAAGSSAVLAGRAIAPTVTSVNTAEDWISTTWSTTIDLSTTPGTDFILQFTGCCRLSSIFDANHDQTFIVRSRVAIRAPINRPPTAASLPIITVIRNQAVNFVMPAFDPDGEPLTYALSPLSESGMVVQAPAGLPTPLSVNASTGRVTWVPPTVGLFAVQFTVSDPRGASTVIDVLFSVLASGVTGTPPVFTLNSVAPPPSPSFNVIRGAALDFTVQAATNTSPASSVTLTSSGLPLGANMSPSLPTSNIGAVQSAFHWVPASNQVGSYIVSYAATAASGLQSLLNININVTNNAPTIMCTPTGTIAATGAGGASVTIDSLLADGDGDSLTYQLTVDGVPQGVVTGIAPPATRSLTRQFAVGTHTYSATVTDNFSPTVSCAGTFEVKDLTPPALNLPDDITTFASGPVTAVVFSATGTDDVDPTPAVSCVPASGTSFPVGTTPVTCTATDDANNSVQGTFQVTVQKVATSLSPLASIDALTGNTISMATTLTRTTVPAGPIAGETVVFTITRPSGSSVAFVAATDANGVATLSALPVSERGVHTISAAFGATSWLEPASSASGTVTAYQRTQFELNPISGVAGGQTVVSARLVTVPQMGDAPNQTVEFSFAGNALPTQTATTGLFGEAAGYLAEYPDAGVFGLTTTFSNAAGYFTNAAGALPPQPTVATSSVTIAHADTAIALTAPPTGFVGDPGLVLTAFLTRVSAPAGAIAGGAVEFVVTGPSPSTAETILPSTTASDGYAMAQLTAMARGSYTLTARFAGTGSLAASSSAPAPLSMYQRTKIVFSPLHTTAGAATTLSAQLLSVPQDAPIAGETIDFSSAAGNQSGVTDATGTAAVSATFPYASITPVTATFSNVAGFYVNGAGSMSPTGSTENAVVDPAQAALSPLAVPAFEYVGHAVGASTTLSRLSAPAGPASGETVTFTLTNGPDGPNSQSHAITTATDGTASTTFMLNRGQYTVVAAFAGTAVLLPASVSSTVISYQMTTIALSGASAIANAPVTLEAQLHTIPDGSPLAGQPVTFSFGGVIPNATVVTNAGGVATVTVSFPMVGSFPVSVTFDDGVEYYANHLGQPSAETATASVVITDPTGPVITPTLTGTLGANGWYTSDVTVSWSVTDSETAITSSSGCATSVTTADGAKTSTCAATSGGGTTTQSVSFKRDATAPAQTLPASINIGATTVGGAVVNFTVARSDATSGVAVSSCAPASGSQFAIGTTTVSCSVTDNAGLTTSGSFTVTVTDTIAPVISSAAPSQSSMWPPNHKMVAITFSVAATDNLGVAPVCTIAGISSNEPQNGLGDGDTPDDWLITGALSAELRAERAGGGNGRVYTAAIRCVDESGNAATTKATVRVPKSQGR